MANLLIPIIVIILHVGLVPIAVAAAGAPPAVPGDDRSALLAFLSNVSADSGGALADWGRSPEFCNWTGVTCGGGPGTGRRRVVTQLVLSGKGLCGVISPALGRLSFVTVLDLSSNALSGEIPPELGSLSMLTQLSLANNLLEGTVPAGVGLLQKLYFLDLSGNRLSGSIPGTLFCNCSALQYLDLANNSLAGDIPYADECRLPSLRYLLLWSNDLSGPIPPALANSSMLEWVDFESNYLAGELPARVFDRLPRLQYLYLSYNNLSSHDGNTDLDPFFRSLKNCTHLQELELAGNDLGGRLPPFVGELPRGLRQLHLEDNAISGSIPPNISSLVNLTYLNLSNNLLNGSIPPDMSPMRRLERLYLSNNLLSGDIPKSIGEIPHLGLVDFSGNRLAGAIPDTFSNLTQLRRLMLHHNQLSGAIPPSLGDCLNLEILDLSYNGLQGPIPTYVAALSSLKLYLNLSNNHLEGPLPLELSKMDMILALDLSANKIAGTIPSQLGSCVALEYLNLSGNALRGALPAPVAALPFLQVLDVSRNALSGSLPESLQVSTSLREANFSYNNFSGVVPHAGGGVLANLSAEAFRGNPGLCGDIPGIARCQPKRARRRRPLVPAAVGIVVAVSFMLCAVGCRSMVTTARAKRSGRLADVEDQQAEREHPRISYRELCEATGGFVQEGLIGAGRFGRVYEGTLRDGARVAVKVLDPKGGGEVSGSFKRECEVLKRTRHKNLVRVITTCSTASFNALVLPLMPKGSLDGVLYPPGDNGGGGGGLGFGQIMGVVSDVAEGMAYLHHYAPVRVVHCDLKPSNVLLDEGMRAVISDFGIARLVAGGEASSTGDESAPCNSITGLLQGSVGYIAPGTFAIQYGLGGHPSTQGDVYSFGVMLLELITGKRPTDVIFQEGLTLHDWVRRHYPHDVAAVLAHAPWRERALQSPEAAAQVAVVELIELGLVCTQHSPALRPTMADVCHEITLLKEDLARHDAGGGGRRSFSTKDSPTLSAGGRADDDRSALLSFKSGVSSDPHGALANWGDSPNVCNWTGVACDTATSRVTKLSLMGHELSGEVSPALGNLSHLTVLNLSGNQLAGRIPPELGNLRRLTTLDMSMNSFAGKVPAKLGNLSSLNYVDVSRNRLEGPVPAELTRARDLIYLNLGENDLTGHIPEAIFCNFSAVQYIDLSSNSLDGEIPIRGDCPLPDLMFLVLWSNNLVGGIPPSISNSTKLRWLLLESNYLTGELPSDMFGNMRDLQLLHLSNNYLVNPENNTNLEPFFASLTNCTSLRELGVALNEIAGAIPPLVGSLSPGLKLLHLELNKISGPIPGNLTDLANLTALNLSYNFLDGPIPPGIAAMPRLERLYLSNNLLSGEIPPSLGTIPKLGLVDLSHNRLTGAVPATLCNNLTQLRVLVLSHNHLSGTIPPTLAQCVNLQNFDLSHNAFQGKIPADLSALTGLLYLNLSSNQLEGPIPAAISKMVMLQVLNLSSNRLSGTIPPQLGSCVALEYFNVSGNALDGDLPDTIGALPFLQVLDVSYNGLTGALPLTLETAPSLQHVNFSFNGFSGEVPAAGAFASFPADAFLGDGGLCGSVAGLPRCGGGGGVGGAKHKHRALRDRRVVLPVVITVVGFTLAIIGAVACRAAARADVRRDSRRSMLLTDAEKAAERDHPRVSHRELAEATRGFEPSQLIGAGRFGRVYEGTLRDGTRVAVKVLDPKSGGEVSRSFKRECQVLRRTRHRNLVRVVTACSQPDFHALVLPLMPNGSLEGRLYPPDGRPGRGLDLAQLVSIAGDVAEGLAYLHHYAPVRVVHCDLKPSNVLLDDDMTAVVADFGIAQLVKDVGDSNDFGGGNTTGSSADPCNSITGLLQGSIGYIAPEYGMGGHASTQGDVYSFGVMLLELITGKRPTDVIFQEGLTLHDWVKRHYPQDVGEIVAESWLTDAASAVADERLWNDVMAELIDLGIVCTQHAPSERPTMVEVCHEITLLKEDLAKHLGAGAAATTATVTASASVTTMTASERSYSATDSSSF
ncbi:hypothetical protein U9M48_029511 [Paspalum notatum var. saurae]|uniref:non-specific serine/threonine protein kinase n=1 Tax=Paspalum notatum var. saurae TaxID=547442 RepID=A0AAQ3X2R8_PASNO